MSASVRTKQAFATGLAVALTGGGLAAVAAPAGATTGSVTYTCSDTLDPGKNYSLPVEIDSDAPARVFIGDTANITFTSKTTLPSASAKIAYETLGARYFDGGIATDAVVKIGAAAPAATVVNQAIPETVIPPQTIPNAVPFTASNASTVPFKPTGLGDLELTAGDFVATLNLKDSAKAAIPGDAKLTCKAPPGKAPIIDTVAVASRTTTSLTLAAATGVYGAPVVATAKVATTAGTIDGEVAFVVGGVTTKAPVKGDTATVSIDRAPAGVNSVVATYVPKDATHYEGSSSAPAPLTISKAATTTGVTITGKRVGRATRAAIQVAGANGTVPTGNVRLVLTKIGNPAFHKARAGTLTNGARTFKLGRLAKGKYKVVVKYVGDANHLRSKATKRFKVRP